MIPYEGTAETIHFANWYMALNAGKIAERIDEAVEMAVTEGNHGGEAAYLADTLRDSLQETLNDIFRQDIIVDDYPHFNELPDNPDAFSLLAPFIACAVAMIDFEAAAKLIIREQAKRLAPSVN